MKNVIFLILLFIPIALSAKQYSFKERKFPKLEIHSKHWIGGYPLGTPETNDLIIYDLYALSNNDTTKFADWVAYKLTGKEVNQNKSSLEIMGFSKSADTKRNWRKDPFLSDTETVDESYYTKDITKTYDRGHQAPLASFLGSIYFSQTNYLSNITPQKKYLNRGPWKHLEEAVRNYVRKGNIVWVMTGPIYSKNKNKVSIPIAYWKIISTIRKTRLWIESYIMSQNEERKASPKKFRVKVKDVEKKSNLEFFWDIKNIKGIKGKPKEGSFLRL